MVVRLKNGTIDAIEETENKRLRIVKISSKDKGIKLTLEIPDALCETLDKRKSIDVILDSKKIVRSKLATLYLDGTIFNIAKNDGIEVVGTIGGLRLEVSIPKPTPAQNKTFGSGKLYLMIN